MAIKNIDYRTVRGALDWFDSKVQASSNSIRTRLLAASENHTSSTVTGKMFLFRYDPKYKHTLPIYDIYPLVFPIEMYKNGFLGLNIHYLTSYEREAFLNRLLKYATATHLTERSRLRLSYDLIASTKVLASPARPCIKRYLYSHVRTHFVEIPATEWDRVVVLPIEKFIIKG